MKNMSVGKKLLVGFGAVIFLIIAILSVSVITSISRNSQLQYLNAITDMQSEANQMLNDYNAVRVELRSVLDDSVNNDDAYNLVLENMQKVKNQLAAMEAYSADLNGYGGEAMAGIKQSLSEVENSLNTTRASDLEIRADNDAVIAAGETAMQALANMYEKALVFTEGAADDSSQAVRNRMENVMKPVQEIMQDFTEVRVQARDFIQSQDVSLMPKLRENIDVVQQKLTGLRAALSGTAAESVGQMSSALTDYADNLEALAADDQKNTEVSEETRTEFYDVLDEITAFVSGVAEELTHSLNDVVNTSNMVMFLIIGIALFSIAFAVFIALYITKGITGPVGMMMGFLKQVGDTGNLTFSEEELRRARAAAVARDEVGQSLAAFVQMLEHLIYYGEALQTVAAR
ncbi:MAG: methyl-accepting chemotaxis protein, partial [Oscillospiraceae bacterium]|nr:methyl-accepting chemotaxis protein [Oscillospiraceae bacterium]